MSRRDAEILALQEWLQQLGCTTQLQSQEIKLLQAPKMRSVWRHLQKYVKPVRTVQTIRKNLLLARLQKENIQPNKIGSFKIQSREEFTLVERVSDIQQQIDSKNSERKAIDDEIKSLVCNIGEKKYNIIREEKEIKETKDKTALLTLKCSQVEKDIEKLVTVTSKASALKTMHISDSHLEDTSNLTNVASILMKNKLTPSKSLCKEDKVVLLNLTYEYPMKTIYRAFLLASDNVSKSLKRFYVNLEIPEESLKETLVCSGTNSFSYHLKLLNSVILQNQLNIVSCLEKVKRDLAVLEKEKTELVDCIKGICKNRNDSDEISEADEFVNKILSDILSLNKGMKLKELTEKIVSECSEYDHLNHQVQYNKGRENELHEEVGMKVSLINELYSKIYKYNSKIYHEKADVFQTCSELVSRFLTEMNKQNHEDVFLASEDMISKEIEMFHGAPLCALTRKWENSYELLPAELIEELSIYPELRVFLLQTDPKNILKSILEKKWWSSRFLRNIDTKIDG